MKEPWEWEENDLLELVQSKVQESISLDYKRSSALELTDDRKKRDLSKDVSAFANSAGGTLIYGVEEDHHLPTKVDAGCDPRQVTKERIEQVLNSQIQRRISGIRIKQVQLNMSSPGRVAYVVAVPQSAQAPHQAADKKFYKRFNFESVPMEEYEIRDVAQRNEAPDLESLLELVDAPMASLHYKEDAVLSEPIGVRLIVQNHSATTAHYAVFKIAIDKKITVVPSADLKSRPDTNFVFGKEEGPTASLWQLSHAVPQSLPLFRGTRFEIANFQLRIPRGVAMYFIIVSTIAPDMQERRHTKLLVIDGESGAHLVGPQVPVGTQAPAIETVQQAANL